MILVLCSVERWNERDCEEFSSGAPDRLGRVSDRFGDPSSASNSSSEATALIKNIRRNSVDRRRRPQCLLTQA